MKKMIFAVMMMAGLLAGCSNEPFNLVANTGQRGAGSTVQVDGKEGVMTVVKLAPTHPEGVQYHVTMPDQGGLKTLRSTATGNVVTIHLNELKLDLHFTQAFDKYVCLDCHWISLPVDWAAAKAL